MYRVKENAKITASKSMSRDSQELMVQPRVFLLGHLGLSPASVSMETPPLVYVSPFIEKREKVV